MPTDNKCFLEKAIAEKNPEICKSHWCYMKYYETQDSSVCSSLSNKGDSIGIEEAYSNYKDDCYEYFSYKEDNVASCNLIQREETKEHCLKDIGTQE